MTQIESLLRKEIGLDAASIGSTLIHRAVRLRMKALGLKKPEEYGRLLKHSPAALEELIEAVVVTETWFFRDREPFAAFGRLVLRWLSTHPVGTLRALSVPCASGEEPYSLAMALLDACVPPHRFVIDGVDISARALARAKHAVYGRNSFRAKDLAFRDRYFRHVKDGYALNSEVREGVRFHRGNVLGDDFLGDGAPYDFIFCRNLLIYFDRATQVRALERLHRLLAPEGVLFVGPAELPLVAGNGFVSANLPLAFACHKPTAPAMSGPERRARSRIPVLPTPVRTPWSTIGPGEPRAPQRLRPPTGTHQTPEPISDLDAARQLADAGRLEEAAAICESHLRKQGPSAQVYFLRGLLCDAGGDLKASDYYRKALYLEPNHYETLLHMALLLEKSGDSAGARVFKRRAERAQQNCALAGLRPDRATD